MASSTPVPSGLLSELLEVSQPLSRRYSVLQQQLNEASNSNSDTGTADNNTYACDLPYAGPLQAVQQFTVSVCIKSGITLSTFRIWSDRWDAAFNVKPKSRAALTNSIAGRILKSELCDNATFIVADEKCSLHQLMSWANLSTWPIYRDSMVNDRWISVLVLTSDWLVNCLKSKEILDPNPYVHTHLMSARQVAQCTTGTRISLSIDQPMIQSQTSLEKRKQPASEWDSAMSKYACVISGTTAASPRGVDSMEKKPLNSLIVDIFTELESIHDAFSSVQDEFRKMTYRRAAAAISLLPPLTRENLHVVLAGVHSIGAKTFDKIVEIAETGTLKKLEYFLADEKVQAIRTFMKIHGIGSVNATKLYTMGFKSIDDLRQRGQHVLNDIQRIGLLRLDDLQQRIPRDEVEQIGDAVRQCANRLVGLPAGVEIQAQICGSYRRGKMSSGDVDVLLSPPIGFDGMYNVVPMVIDALTESGFLTDHLSFPDDYHSVNRESLVLIERILDQDSLTDSPRTYMGICKLKKSGAIHRRLDIKYYPRALFPFAILYFTGSDHFNRSMRAFANKRNFSLNDKGLVVTMNRSKVKKRSDKVVGKRIHCDSERQIFEVLGLPFKEPWDRNCFDAQNCIDRLTEKGGQ